jgi:hypothetical protein
VTEDVWNASLKSKWLFLFYFRLVLPSNHANVEIDGILAAQSIFLFIYSGSTPHSMALLLSFCIFEEPEVRMSFLAFI